MNKSDLLKYAAAALVILVIFYLGSLNSKISTLEKTVGSLKTAGSANAANTGQPQAQPVASLDQVKSAFNKSLIKFGDDSKKVVALEISDPSCPYCQIAGGMNKALNSQSTEFKLVADGGTYVSPVQEIKKLVDAGKASFALIYFPGHGSGEMGMKALYCAFEVGKFWEANDLIMNDAGYDLMNNKVRNDKTQSGVLADFLSSAVDKNTMKTCLDSGKYDSQLATDQALAQSLSVQGTPGFFINATNFAGAYSYTTMESAVTDALK
jgi:protein-disulfide isomerase